MELELPPHVSFPDSPASRPCPACEGERCRRFYEVLGIPVHSCVLLSDAAAARAFPLGDLCLAHCPDCGFLFNDLYDVALLDYSEDYEESQGCSATFRAFLEETGQKLLERTQLQGGTLVEIGCGRGDFLALMTELGAAQAIGIDPSGTAGQALLASGQPVECRHKSYDGADFELPAQVIACRHTLEHLPAVQLVLAQARAHLAASGGEHLFIEVPDVLRVLSEGAFWDIYYEHCSYFTAGSLERLALRTGFAPSELELVYAGQYLQLTAKAVAAGDEPTGDRQDLTTISEAITTFRDRCRASLVRLHRLLQDNQQADRGPTCLWGAGSKATGFLTTLGAGDQVAAVVDIDPAKRGKFVAGTGHPIIAPEDLGAYAPGQVLIMNPIYLDEIRADLQRMGIEARVEAV